MPCRSSGSGHRRHSSSGSSHRCHSSRAQGAHLLTLRAPPRRTRRRRSSGGPGVILKRSSSCCPKGRLLSGRSSRQCREVPSLWQEHSRAPMLPQIGMQQGRSLLLVLLLLSVLRWGRRECRGRLLHAIGREHRRLRQCGRPPRKSALPLPQPRSRGRQGRPALQLLQPAFGRGRQPRSLHCSRARPQPRRHRGCLALGSQGWRGCREYCGSRCPPSP